MVGRGGISTPPLEKNGVGSEVVMGETVKADCYKQEKYSLMDLYHLTSGIPVPHKHNAQVSIDERRCANLILESRVDKLDPKAKEEFRSQILKEKEKKAPQQKLHHSTFKDQRAESRMNTLTTKLDIRDIKLLSVGIPVHKGDPDVSEVEQGYYQQLLLIKEAEEDLIRRAKRDQMSEEEKMDEQLKEANELKSITEEEFAHSRDAIGEQNLGEASNAGTNAFCDISKFNDNCPETHKDSPVTCLKLCCGGKNNSPICSVTSILVQEHALCPCDCKVKASSGLQSYPHLKPTFAEMIGAPSKVRSSIIDGKKIVQINSCDFDEETKECQEMLVGNFLGKRLPYMFVKNTLLRLWELKGDLEMTTKGKHLYFFKFSCDEDKQKVLDMGHQHIASRVFFIRNWRPFIEFEPMEMKSIPTWVMLQDLPDQFWNPDGIGRVASSLGQPLFLDKETEQRRRGRSFARVCIEMEVDSKFPNSITVEMDGVYNIDIPVAYNWIPPSCEGCQVFGHNSQNCPHKMVEEIQSDKGDNNFDAPRGMDDKNKKHKVDKDGWSTTRNGGNYTKPTDNIATSSANKIPEGIDSTKDASKKETKARAEATNKDAQGLGDEKHKLSKSVLKREKKKIAKQAREEKRLVEEALPSMT
ncbi:hypothetical protein GIB67_029224 [Kingdonia uniflora]|uniref:DUF4283 domain-containing protein n=1 Tax=Kingdonia uniflora TaxID=39325 RepID=A0A7J7NAT0_9MAGN|nr:hypothetical protein GIB67_029224 [Kingdonia uniflora]